MFSPIVNYSFPLVDLIQSVAFKTIKWLLCFPFNDQVNCAKFV